jgi:hypothetical protein
LREADGLPPSPRLGFGEPGLTEVRPEPDTTYGAPSLFASSIEEPRRRGGLSIWFAAAGSLVLGILIGFASGYRAGQDQSGEGTTAAKVTEQGPSTPTPTSRAADGQPFSESAVAEPVHLDPEPIVPSPVARVPPVKGQVPVKADPPVVGRVPAPTGATGGGPAVAASGPGSLEVISRPAGAQVILDGRAVGRTPLSIADVAVGEHAIRLELPGFNRWSTTVDVKAGNPIRVTASLEQ